jgi:PH domain
MLISEETLREQGFVGDITCGLFSRMGMGSTYGLYSQLPFWEGKLLRKKTTGLFGRGLKARLSNWVKRWYVLRKSQFAYFKSREDENPLGFIDLAQAKWVGKIRSKDAEVLREVPQKYRKLCFGVETINRKYVFLAENADDMAMWTEALDFARRLFSPFSDDSAQLAHAEDGGIDDFDDRHLSTKDFRRNAGDEIIINIPKLLRADSLSWSGPRSSTEYYTELGSDPEYLIGTPSGSHIASAAADNSGGGADGVHYAAGSITSSSPLLDEHQTATTSSGSSETASLDEASILDDDATNSDPRCVSPVNNAAPASVAVGAAAKKTKKKRKHHHHKRKPRKPKASAASSLLGVDATVRLQSLRNSVGSRASSYEMTPRNSPLNIPRVVVPPAPQRPHIVAPHLTVVGRLHRGDAPRSQPRVAEEFELPAPRPTALGLPQRPQRPHIVMVRPTPVARLVPVEFAPVAVQFIEMEQAVVVELASPPPPVAEEAVAVAMPMPAVVTTPAAAKPPPIPVAADNPLDQPAPPPMRGRGGMMRGGGGGPRGRGRGRGRGLRGRGGAVDGGRRLPAPSTANALASLPTAPKRQLLNNRIVKVAPARGRRLTTSTRAGGATGEQAAAARRRDSLSRAANAMGGTGGARSSGGISVMRRNRSRPVSTPAALDPAMLAAAGIPMSYDGTGSSTGASSVASSSRAAGDLARGVGATRRADALRRQSAPPNQRVSLGSADSLQLRGIADFVNAMLLPLADTDTYLAGVLPASAATVLGSMLDGVVLAKLLHAHFPDVINMRRLTVLPPTQPVSSHVKSANLELVLQAVNSKLASLPRFVGAACIAPVTVQDFASLNAPALEAFIASVVRACLIASVHVANFPSLLALLPATDASSAAAGTTSSAASYGDDGGDDDDDEDDEDDEARAKLAATPPEVMLCRWSNYHLARSGAGVSLSSEFELSAADFGDGRLYAALVAQLSGDAVRVATPGDAAALFGALKSYGCSSLMLPSAEQLLSTNDRFVHLGVLASVFAVAPFPAREATLLELLGADATAGKHVGCEAARVWMCSLRGVAKVLPARRRLAATSLRAQLADGYLLVRVVEALAPVGASLPTNALRDKPPKTDAERAAMAQAFVDAAKQLQAEGAHTLTPAPILAGDEPTLAAALRMLQLYEIANFQQHRQLEVMTEDGLVEWCNDVAGCLELDVPELNSFSNVSLRTSTFFLYMLYAIFPHAVQIDLVTAGRTPAQATANARYLLHIFERVGLVTKFIHQQIAHGDNEVFLLLAMQCYAFAQQQQDE